MNVILRIGSTGWLAKDASSAAKVMELLGSFQPIEMDIGHHEKTVWFHGKDWGHEMEIRVPGKREVIVKSEGEAIKMRVPEETEAKP